MSVIYQSIMVGCDALRCGATYEAATYGGGSLTRDTIERNARLMGWSTPHERELGRRHYCPEHRRREPRTTGGS